MALTQQQITALLQKEQIKDRSSVIRQDLLNRHHFDEAALFLLELNWANLFEPWRKDYVDNDGDLWFRCKGCGAMVKRMGRESHHSWHKRELLNLT